jgi:Zn-dependent protease with chaperone function
MILPYTLRLVVLTLGCFYLIHALFAIAANLLAPWILALAQRRNSSSAARLLLAARLFPPAAAILAVAGICVPSYLWLEPQTGLEQVGLGCLAVAFLGAVSWLIAAKRGLRAIVFSIRYARQCLVHGTPGVFALAGILRPRVLISRDVFRQLSHAELAVALRHERAHAASRDNLKRLLLLLAPDVLPFRILPGLGTLENAWMRFTEWSADDRAVDGDPRRAVSLAGALVRVARMRAPAEMSPLATSLVASAGDLEARVNRLLNPAPRAQNSPQVPPAFLAAAGISLGCLLAAITAPATLQAAHQLLERLIH